MAPEMLAGKEYGAAVDWWMLGQLLHELLVGQPAFYHRDHARTEEAILRERLVLPKGLSPHARDLLQGLLTKDPRDRLGSRLEVEVLEHPFFASLDLRALNARTIPAPFIPEEDPTRVGGIAVQDPMVPYLTSADLQRLLRTGDYRERADGSAAPGPARASDFDVDYHET